MQEQAMNTRTVLTILAAIVATAAPLLIFAFDTASTPEAAPSVATAARLLTGLLGA
jgi:hypothetical protein